MVLQLFVIDHIGSRENFRGRGKYLREGKALNCWHGF